MPEEVLGPSFQMSFCAVMGIVAWYEGVSARVVEDERTSRPGALRFMQVYFGGIVATTVAATLATAPFATFHFQRFAVHSLPGNLVALPVVGLLVMPWALVGIVAGWLALGRVDDTGAGRMIGALIIAMLALHYWRSRTLSEEELAKVPSWFAPMIGLVAGFTTMVANAAGPVMVLYLLAMRLSKLEFLGVAAAFFLIINWVKVPFAVQLGLITPDSLALNLWLLAPVAIGALVGRWVIARIDQHAFENITFALAVLASVKLLMGT